MTQKRHQVLISPSKALNDPRPFQITHLNRQSKHHCFIKHFWETRKAPDVTMSAHSPGPMAPLLQVRIAMRTTFVNHSHMSGFVSRLKAGPVTQTRVEAPRFFSWQSFVLEAFFRHSLGRPLPSKLSPHHVADWGRWYNHPSCSYSPSLWESDERLPPPDWPYQPSLPSLPFWIPPVKELLA